MKAPQVNPAGFLLAGLIFLAPVLFAQEAVLQTVVLFNRNMPASSELAEYYCEKRDIPPENLCGLDLPADESISRMAYEKQLRDPLLEFLREKRLIPQMERNDGRPSGPGWKTTASSVRFLVLVHGVPLKVRETTPSLISKLTTRYGDPLARTDASVDSELSCLLLEPYELAGPIANPLFRRFTWDELNPRSQLLLVCGRLDGPDVSTARAAFDACLSAEKSGLEGRAVFDFTPEKGNEYERANRWIVGAADLFEQHGFEVVRHPGPGVIGENEPIDDVAIYFGWYAEHATGFVRRKDFRFVPGAVAYHLHSTSASSLRTRDRFWVGPLLAAGAGASLGAVAEPYLGFTPELDVFARRLLSGMSFGESALMSISHNSWQITVVGDPHYRPFAESELEPSEKSAVPATAWGVIRRSNWLVRHGKFQPALALLAEREKTDPLLKEKAADLFALNGETGKAVAGYFAALDNLTRETSAFRVAGKLKQLLESTGRAGEFQSVADRLSEQWPSSVFRSLILDSKQAMETSP